MSPSADIMNRINWESPSVSVICTGNENSFHSSYFYYLFFDAIFESRTFTNDQYSKKKLPYLYNVVPVSNYYFLSLLLLT